MNSICEVKIDGEVLRPSKAAVLSFSVSEELSRLFEIVLVLQYVNPADASTLLGKQVTITIETAVTPENQFKTKVRHWNGIVAAAGLDQNADSEVLTRLVVRPKLWKATRLSNFRVWKDQSVKGILGEVLQQHGLIAKFKSPTSASNEVLVYKVQYGETDFNFISRLMEDTGLYYWFEHTASSHDLVIAGAMSAHEMARDGCYPSLEFADLARPGTGTEPVEVWRPTFETQPGKSSVREWNYTEHTTRFDEATSAIKAGAESDVIKDYQGNGFHTQPWTGLGKLRQEEVDARYCRVFASGSIRGVAVGTKFTMKNHPVASENVDHLVVSSRIDMNFAGPSSGGRSYDVHCSFTAMRGAHTFRPQRLTPKPVIPGPQSAVVSADDVTGPKSGTNSGHVKVRLMWADDFETLPVRVASGMASNGFGMISLPRVGDEVIVEFMDGDPDRPLVTGRVYNPKNKTKYGLPDHRYVATWRSQFVGHGGYNEIRLDDRGSNSHMHLWAGKDFYLFVKEFAFTQIDKDEVHIVKQNQKISVTQNVTRVIDKDLADKIGGHSNLKVASDHAVDVGGKHSVKSGADHITESGAAISAKAAANIEVKSGATINIEAGANVHLKGPGGITIETSGTLSLKGSMVVIEGSGNVMIKGGTVMINSGGSGSAASSASPKAVKAPTEAAKPPEPSDKLP